MKKLICIILILMLPVVALADDMDSFMAKFNVYSKHYGSPKLTSDQLKDDVFSGDGWKLTVDMFAGFYKGVGIYGEKAEIFLPMCAQAGMVVVGDFDGSSLRTFLGDLLYAYMSATTGKSVPMAVFGSYAFSIEKQGNGFFFAMTGL